MKFQLDFPSTSLYWVTESNRHQMLERHLASTISRLTQHLFSTAKITKIFETSKSFCDFLRIRRVDETRTRINVRIPNAAGQPITVLPYVIKKISHKPFLDLCEMSFWYFPGFLPYFFILVLSLFIFWWHTHTLLSELFPKTVATWLAGNSGEYHMCMQCHHNFYSSKIFM